ncbi:RagB/SusD family nutrient uptake outer membrane protein [Hymenobacter cheonanensis]|uniref:RagB/SusD family nutrient uptake outer membrane protein n=1 Tax=Hymenobacter sp. CA2-7 TaxID=3063993 RepID=UPI002712F51C|nr:RagB/SusD family nutrient uptake outer membrane protein [Hymenobacter sp. CA2-7]MDO7885254.1 RagB/SusD family nutrient uptake outer membrane protein [Hymenobacter sp. CA2-7]
MKKIVPGLLTAVLLLSGLEGCNNKLNVQPTSSIDAAQAFASSSDVQAALVGCYAGLQSVNLYGGYWQFLTDLVADNGDMSFVGTFSQPQEAQRKTLLITNSQVSATWLSAYDVINRANNVLANLSKLDTPTQQASVEGEAKFIRSLVYFDLVRTYARDWNDGTPSANPGVPLITTPTLSVADAKPLPRNTVAEVYAQIITDLTTAEAKLTTSAGLNTFSASRYACAGLLARIYLQQGNFTAAAAAANRAISSTARLNAYYGDNFGYNQTTNTANQLVSNTTEDIFTIQISAQSGTNQLNTFYARTRRADVNINAQFLNLFETGDTRKTVYFTTAGVTYTTKYDGLYGNIKLMRIDEMLLTHAEANFRAGTAVGATPLADVNTIRARAGLPALTTLTLAAILKERRIELAFEGFRLGDLKRNQESTIDPLTTTAIAWNSPRLVFPIPLREINANPNLVQNAGY